MARKLIQKDTGMEILISDITHYGRDGIIINRLMLEHGFIENKDESNLLNDIEIEIKANNQLDKDNKRTQSWDELTIDHGNITTDMVTFRKLIELCGNNKIKLNIINGNINIHWDK